MTPATLQLSEVTGTPRTAVVVQFPDPSDEVVVTTSEGQVIAGVSLSVTVTVMASVAVSPAPSVLVYVIVVTPIGKVYVPTWPEPLPVVAPVITQVRLLVQLSLKTALVIATATVQLPVPSADVVVTTSGAAVTVGASLSVTVTVMASVAVSPAPSVLVYVIVVTPIGKVYVPTWPDPLAVVAPVIAQVSVLVQLSLKTAFVTATATVQLP